MTESEQQLMLPLVIAVPADKAWPTPPPDKAIELAEDLLDEAQQLQAREATQ
jgi:hypothetical protein